MIHENILRDCGYDASYSGFAFGLGVERFIMIKYGVKDIRNFYTNNLRFLKKF
jgi:phenylalanyl-tRNA synthetase alpha chain